MGMYEEKWKEFVVVVVVVVVVALVVVARAALTPAFPNHRPYTMIEHLLVSLVMQWEVCRGRVG